MRKLFLFTLLLAVTSQAADNLTLPLWLAGNWKTAQRDMVIEETWNAPAAGLMMGMSRTFTPERTRSFEFVRIERRGTDVFYVAQPQGEKPTEFRMTKLEDGMIVFENPKHDFPKRISYRRVDADHVTARIDDGKETGRDFVYERVK
jgi:hypothetical protein